MSQLEVITKSKLALFKQKLDAILGNSDISSIGDGTIKGAIVEVNNKEPEEISNTDIDGLLN